MGAGLSDRQGEDAPGKIYGPDNGAWCRHAAEKGVYPFRHTHALRGYG